MKVSGSLDLSGGIYVGGKRKIKASVYRGVMAVSRYRRILLWTFFKPM
jgi:hypothetical protein